MVIGCTTDCSYGEYWLHNWRANYRIMPPPSVCFVSTTVGSHCITCTQHNISMCRYIPGYNIFPCVRQILFWLLPSTIVHDCSEWLGQCHFQQSWHFHIHSATITEENIYLAVHMQYAPSLFSMNGRCLPTLCSGWTEIENIIRQRQRQRQSLLKMNSEVFANVVIAGQWTRVKILEITGSTVQGQGVGKISSETTFSHSKKIPKSVKGQLKVKVLRKLHSR